MDFENFEEDIENEHFENESFDEISEDENFEEDIENEELDCIDEEKNYTIMDDLKVKNKKMYFDEEFVKDLIRKEGLSLKRKSSEKYRKRNNGKFIVNSKCYYK